MRGFMALLIWANMAASLPAEDGWVRHAIDSTSRGADGVRLADVNGDQLPDIVTGWEEGGVTRVYLHPGPAKVTEPWPQVTVGKTPSVEDAVFVDLDGDGAMDVVSCCEGRTKTIFVHWAPSDASQYLDSSAWKQDPLPASKGMMAWMFALPMQIDGRDGIDLVIGGKNSGAQIGWWESPANPRSLHDWRWHPIRDAGWIMSLRGEDMDGDGDRDIVATDRKGKRRGCLWLENPNAFSARKKPWREHAIGDQGREVMFMSIADLDGDDQRDIISAVKPAGISIFQRVDRLGTKWESQHLAYPTNMGTAKAVAAGDLDQDGRLDLVITCEQANRPKSGVRWLQRTNEGWRDHEISGPEGIKFDRIELLDLDRDGDVDVLTCEEREGRGGLGVIWYENPSVNR